MFRHSSQKLPLSNSYQSIIGLFSEPQERSWCTPTDIVGNKLAAAALIRISAQSNR